MPGERALLIVVMIVALAGSWALAEDKLPMGPGRELTAQRRAEIAKEVAAVFEKAVKEHAKAADELAGLSSDRHVPMREGIKFKPWSSGALEGGDSLNRSDSLEGCVVKVRAVAKKGRDAEVAAYVRAAAAFLRHKDPKYRAVACEMLCHFPHRAVELGATPLVGKLLDDRSVAFAGASLGLGQVALYISRLKNGIDVAFLARRAMARMTTFSFAGADAFETWWAQNKDYRGRLWYWAARWRTVKPAADLACLAHLKPLQALKFILLVKNRDARLAEALRAFEVDGKGPKGEPVRWAHNIDCFEPRPVTVTAYVKKHKLKGTILAILRRQIDWACVTNNPKAWGTMLYYMLPTLRAILTKADVPVIERLLAEPEGVLIAATHLQRELIKLAIDLDADGAERILLAHWEQDRTRYFVAANLIRLTGLKHWDRVKAAYRDGAKPWIIRALAGLKSPEVPGILRELLQAEDWSGPLEDDLAKYGYEVSSWSLLMLRTFADAGKTLNGGKVVIKKEDLARARTRGPTKMERELTAEKKAHNARVRALRAEIVKRLDAFFAEAAKPAARKPRTL